jgi:uncharacterized protein
LRTYMLSLDVHYLLAEPAGTTEELHIEEGEWRLADDLVVALLQGEIELLRTDYGLFAQGEIATQVQIQCARCLAPISCSLTIRLADQFAYNPERLAQDENPVFPILGRGTIDLAPPLREHILLDLPLHPLCQPDCRGLCSQCGANLNETQCGCAQEEIDPRLAVLQALLAE